MKDETLLLRQVHPGFIQSDFISEQVFTITSQVFKPTPKDEMKLSVYNGDKFEPEQSFLHYTNELKLSSAGVIAVNISECNEVGLTVTEDNLPFEGHTVIDYTGKIKPQIEKIAKILKARAMKRGWLYKQV